MKRAFSQIVIKTIDEDQRIIEGTATSPVVDSLGDIIEPLGAQFSLPLPLLWQHRSDQPVGHVEWAKATKAGIKFRARIASTTTPGALKDRLDEAWQTVKIGLVRAVSVGFKSVEVSRINDGGLRFIKWMWLELSLVTIPANPEATISQIKAAFGNPGSANHQPGASGKPKPKEKGTKVKTFAEMAAELEAQIAPKELRMKSLMQATIDDGRELNESEAEEFDDLASETKGLKTQLARLRALDSSAATAKAVTGNDDVQGSASRAGRVHAEVKTHEEKGIGFARLVQCYARANGDAYQAAEIAKRRYPNMGREQMGQIQMVLKAQVDAGTTTDTSWAEPLAQPTNLVSEFVEYLRPMTIVGKFGVGNIPSLRRIPFNVKFPSQTSGGEGYWVGEGRAKPLTKFNFASTVLRWCKVANIAVLSEDLIRLSSPSAELIVRNSLAEALQARLDTDFVNPSLTAIADVRPASIAQGAATSACSGVDAAAVREDLKTLLGTFVTNNVPTATVVLIMRTAQALSLSLMRNALGGREFPDITMNGGMLEGIPVITSQYVPSGVVIACVASEIYLSDDGGVSIALSREASLEMDTDPSSASDDSPSLSVESQLVSMFQTNSVAIRAERWINWKRRRTAAVSYLTGTGWGGDSDSPIVAI
jgi:HK97 family phage major capsid protein/HK97 family phage prohead protease